MSKKHHSSISIRQDEKDVCEHVSQGSGMLLPKAGWNSKNSLFAKPELNKFPTQ